MVDAPLVIDQVIGNFRVLSLLGSGGMGDVYLAEHVGIQTRVAIKVLHPQISRDAQHVQRFFNEARIVGRIRHSGIAKIFDVGFHAERAYLVMELLEGESLSSRVQRSHLSMTEAVDIAYQIASVLAATHAAGFVHRDLKPDNIFLVPDAELARPRVKILDFGIAKLGGTLVGGPRTIGTMGTPAYMAPEQWGDTGSVDWRADVYSLGCVAFEMVAGRPPFVSDTIVDAFRSHTTVPAPSVRTFVDVPEAWDQLVTRMLAKDPAARAESTAALVQAFDQLRVSIDPDAAWTTATNPSATRAATTLGSSASQVAARPPRGNRLWIAGAVAVLALAVVGTVSAVRGRADTTGPSLAAQPSPPPPPPPTTPPPLPVTPPPPPVVETAPPASTPPPVVETAPPAKQPPAPRHPPKKRREPAKPVTEPPAAPPVRDALEDRT